MALAPLSRPRLLAAAARAGAAQYRRDRDLAGLLPQGASVRGLLGALAAAEADCDADRRAAAPGYSVARHVKILAALMAEARAAATPAAPAVRKAEASAMPAFEYKSAA